MKYFTQKYYMVTVKFIYDLLEKDLLIHEEVFLIALV